MLTITSTTMRMVVFVASPWWSMQSLASLKISPCKVIDWSHTSSGRERHHAIISITCMFALSDRAIHPNQTVGLSFSRTVVLIVVWQAFETPRSSHAAIDTLWVHSTCKVCLAQNTTQRKPQWLYKNWYNESESWHVDSTLEVSCLSGCCRCLWRCFAEWIHTYSERQGEIVWLLRLFYHSFVCSLSLSTWRHHIS
jgi:hypothetical protein